MSRTGPRKYEPLGAYLAGQPVGSGAVTLTLAEVERLVGSPLPAAVWTRGFWSNGRTVARCRSWLGVGWHVVGFDRWRGVVTFARGAPPARDRTRPATAVA
jgi:hypothetical protein